MPFLLPLLSNPYSLAVIALVGILALGGAYWQGRQDGGAYCDVRIADMVNDAQTRKDAEADQAHQAATKLEVEHAKLRHSFTALRQMVDRQPPIGECLADEFVQHANTALRGPTPHSTEPDPTVSEPDPPRKRAGLDRTP